MATLQWVSLVIAVVSAIIAAVACWYTRKAVHLQLISGLFTKYSSAKMGEAVKSLWDTFAQCGPDKDRFLATYLEEMNNTKSKLHNHRRRVSHFYQLLGTLYARRIISGKLIFAQWNQDTLKIISDIIIPVENRLRTDRGEELLPDDHALHRLWEGAKRNSL